MIFTFIKNVPIETNLGKVRLSGQVQKGPGDELVQVFDQIQLEPHSEKEFLTGELGKDFTQKELDLVHTYTTIRMVINMYQELLGKEISWPNKRKLYIYPYGRTGTGGSFSPEENAIQYYKLAINNRWLYSCRYFDVVAHEAGHAVLNAMKPEWAKDTSQETASVVEALCDLTAIFTKLYSWEWFREILSKNQMQNLAIFAPNYGSMLGYKDGIRNFASPRTGTTSHDMSVVFSGAIFRSLISFFSNPGHNTKEQFDKAKQLIALCLKAVAIAKDKGIRFKQLAQSMLFLAGENGWHDWEAILRQHFSIEKIL